MSLRQYGALLGRYLGAQRRSVVILGLLLLGVTVLPLVEPQVIRMFIDDAVAGQPVAHLVRLASLFVVLAVLIQFLGLGQAWFGERVGWHATNELRADLARHTLDLDMEFHNSTTPGEMVERIDGDVNAMSTFFSHFVASVIGSGLLLVGVLVLVTREHLGVGLVLSLFALATVVLLSRVREVAVPHAAAERQATADMFGFLEERLAGTDDLRSLGAGDHVLRGWARVFRADYAARMRAERIGSVIWIGTSGLFGAATAANLAIAAWLYHRGTMSIGTVFLMYQYMRLLRAPLEEIADQIKQFQEAGGGIRRVHDLLARQPAQVRAGTHLLPAGPLAVELRSVEFAYHPGEPILRGIDLEIGAGRVLGLLGRTGAGKTTIGRLLTRLYDAQDGTVRLGGVDVAECEITALRRRIGVVTQDVQLFRATLRENITLFDGDVDDRRVIEVLHDLDLGTWLDGLPSGLDTVMQSGGQGMSAGQSQLVAFARVFLRDPGLVILDEASSRLDPATEQLIESAVDRLLLGRTAILIAHRLATVARADDIAVIEAGRIVEHGRRRQLAADPSSRLSALLATGLGLEGVA
ncbi:MAG TPA: ABC transporter ATP-binding protein [Acidimicrobiales bacterium]|nr:ABC transporter ATP-binding protein [Acidimicrobiales bacterium]